MNHSILSLLLAGTIAVTAAQEPSTPPRFRTEANFVRVDVYAMKEGLALRDLAQGEFELLEDGVPQKIETFEHVEVRSAGPQDARREPQSVAEGRAMAEDPRSRVFVIFLDTYHTGVVGSHQIRRPLIRFLDRVVGPDDLFAVMTPQMSARDISLARKTVTVEGMLSKYWFWGGRDFDLHKDPEEAEYEMCFEESGGCRSAPQPTDERTGLDGGQRDLLGQTGSSRGTAGGLARQLINRRREMLSLNALSDLTLYLGGLREERKAVLVISDGWALYRPDPRLERVGDCDQPPGVTRIGVGPDGKPTTDLNAAQGYASKAVCDRHRQVLANVDNWQTFSDLLDQANRANVSFYPIDSRGLPASDAPIEDDVEPRTDQLRLQHRIETLKSLAESTDGLAVVNNNDLDRGMKRIVEDLTSYYLLGYYSTNAKLDGKFRSIKVRVKRPGVELRARRGYRAATAKEIESGRQLTQTAVESAPPNAVQAAIGTLSGIGRPSPLMTAVSWFTPSSSARSHIWIVAELDTTTGRSTEWSSGGDAEVMIVGENDETVAMAKQPLGPASRVVSLSISDATLKPGTYVMRLRLRPRSSGPALVDTAQFTVSDAVVGQPRLRRRGPTTGNEYILTATSAYRRTERLRVEVPVVGPNVTISADLLDRNGNPMQVPVQAALQPDSGGEVVWATADLTLAPLAPGDYVIRLTVEHTGKRQDVVTAFRMVP